LSRELLCSKQVELPVRACSTAFEHGGSLTPQNPTPVELTECPKSLIFEIAFESEILELSKHIYLGKFILKEW
jgi:hypothetical protein